MHPPSGLGTAFTLRLLLLLLVWGIELCSYASGQPWTCWSWTFWLVLGPVLSLWSRLAVMGLMATYGCYVQTCSALLVWVLSDCTPGQWGHNPCLLSPLDSLTVYFYRCIFISCLSPFWMLWHYHCSLVSVSVKKTSVKLCLEGNVSWSILWWFTLWKMGGLVFAQSSFWVGIHHIDDYIMQQPWSWRKSHCSDCNSAFETFTYIHSSGYCTASFKADVPSQWDSLPY